MSTSFIKDEALNEREQFIEHGISCSGIVFNDTHPLVLQSNTKKVYGK